MRTIRLADEKSRDTYVSFGKAPARSTIRFVLADGSSSVNAKILKSPLHTQYESLLKQHGSDEELVEAMISGDPEIDAAVIGTPIENGQRILIDSRHQPLYRATAKEVLYLPDGSVKEERELTDHPANIQGDFPVKWTGKFIPKSEAYNKFLFARKYQLTHSDGLSYDFLFEMAKELDDKKSLMLLGAGAKGNQPLIFQENGKPYRAFLEGRVEGAGYLLLMHLSNLELKSIL
jgi:hypothetical protein